MTGINTSDRERLAAEKPWYHDVKFTVRRDGISYLVEGKDFVFPIMGPCAKECCDLFASVPEIARERDSLRSELEQWKDIANAREALSDRRARKLDEERAMVDHWSRIAADRLASANEQLERARAAEAELEQVRAERDALREARADFEGDVRSQALADAATKGEEIYVLIAAEREALKARVLVLEGALDRIIAADASDGEYTTLDRAICVVAEYISRIRAIAIEARSALSTARQQDKEAEL